VGGVWGGGGFREIAVIFILLSFWRIFIYFTGDKAMLVSWEGPAVKAHVYLPILKRNLLISEFATTVTFSAIIRCKFKGSILFT